MKMPDEVKLPKIGKFDYFRHNKPVCAIGRAIAEICPEELEEIKGRAMLYTNEYLDAFRNTYKKCAEVLYKESMSGWLVEAINDAATQKERDILYAATWGVLGYRIYNFPEASKLASKTKRIIKQENC